MSSFSTRGHVHDLLQPNNLATKYEIQELKFQYLISMTERGHCVISFVGFCGSTATMHLSEKVGIPLVTKH